MSVITSNVTNFANSWQKHTPGNWKQTHIHSMSHLKFYEFVLYLVKTGNNFLWHTVLSVQHQIWNLHIKVKFSHQITVK